MGTRNTASIYIQSTDETLLTPPIRKYHQLECTGAFIFTLTDDTQRLTLLRQTIPMQLQAAGLADSQTNVLTNHSCG